MCGQPSKICDDVVMIVMMIIAMVMMMTTMYMFPDQDMGLVEL